MPLQCLLRLFFGNRNEEVSPESSLEETDSQTPPPSPSHRVDLPTQPDSYPLHNASASASAAAAEATPLPAPDMSDFKRQNKTALSWSYALLTISFTLLVKFPIRTTDNLDRFVLFAATAICILDCLCLTTAVGIFYYSDTSQLSAELAKAQKKVLTSSKLILLLDFLCRLALRLPFLSFLGIMAAAAVLTLSVLLPLHKAHISAAAALR